MEPHRRGRSLPLLVVCSALAWACNGEMSSERSAGATQDELPQQPTSPEAAPSVPGGETTPDGRVINPRDFTASPGIRRLTRNEYRHTVEQLLGVDLAGANAPAELTVAGHSQIAGAQKVGYEDVERFYTLSEETAAEAAQGVLDASQCQADDTACLQAWAPGFLRRAFRGPVRDEVRERYLTIFDSEDAGATASERLETFLTSVLSSPLFLYRREIGQEPVAAVPGAHVLTDYELASRLSYLVWQSGPDDVLLDAAERGELRSAEQRAAHLRRMLDDERAKQGMRAFVLDWMAVFSDAISAKDAQVLEGTSNALAQDAQRSFDLLVDDVLLGAAGAGGYADLLVAERFPVNAQLAQVLELGELRGDDFEMRPLDTDSRVGVLTHPLVIAAHSKESGASPFPIGAFIYENVLCETIPAPPVIPELDEAELDEDLTLRERLEAQTEGPACKGCHVRIGPPGFAFLPFDPIGRYSASDPSERPYDTTGTIPVGQDMVSFEHIADLSRQLAAHPSTAQCIATRLFRWTYGRFENVDDTQALTALEELAQDEKTAARAMLEAIVRSESFTYAQHEVE